MDSRADSTRAKRILTFSLPLLNPSTFNSRPSYSPVLARTHGPHRSAPSVRVESSCRPAGRRFSASRTPSPARQRLTSPVGQPLPPPGRSVALIGIAQRTPPPDRPSPISSPHETQGRARTLAPPLRFGSRSARISLPALPMAQSIQRTQADLSFPLLALDRSNRALSRRPLGPSLATDSLPKTPPLRTAPVRPTLPLLRSSFFR